MKLKFRLNAMLFAFVLMVLYGFLLQQVNSNEASRNDKLLSRIKRSNYNQDCTIRSEGSSRGSIITPWYPEHYPSNSRCELDIEAPMGHTISLTFEDFDLGPQENCPYDWVSVTEYYGQRGENMIMFCGSSHSRRTVETASRNIKIVFQSDGYNNYRGFYAKYSFVRTYGSTAQNDRNQNQNHNVNNQPNRQQQPNQNQPYNNRNSNQPVSNQNNRGTQTQGGNHQPINNQNNRGTQTQGGNHQPQQLRPNNNKKPGNNQPIASNHNNNNKNNNKQQNKPGSNNKVQVNQGKPVSAGYPPKRCGKNVEDMAEDRNQQSSRIVGGSKSERGEHPWQAMLWEPDNKAFCGGTVLSDMWIISAAHCFDPKLTSHIKWKRVWVRLGKFNQLKKEDDEFNSQIENIYQHPDYNGTSFDSDLSLIKLKKAVRFSPTIQPICLGQAQFIERFFQQIDNLPQTSGNNKGPMGVVTGWGKLAEKGNAPKVLQEIKIPIVSRSYCKGTDSKIVTKNMFCAGYDQDSVGDACQGDSGGPFMIEDQNTWYLIGVVSWGIGCGRAGQYGFYTKVNNFHPWINNIIRSES